jgi:hypothetical protein
VCSLPDSSAAVAEPVVVDKKMKLSILALLVYRPKNGIVGSAVVL